MDVIFGMRLALTTAGLAVCGITSLRRDRFGSLRQEIRMEQSKCNTCQNCYRDHAYQQEFDDERNFLTPADFRHLIRRSGARSIYPFQKTLPVIQDVTLRCQYCGHTRTVQVQSAAFALGD